MSAAPPANATFFISGISHCELRTGQQLSLEHLRSLQQQLAEQAGRARAIQQQLQQQASQQGLRPGGIAVKAEPGAAGAAVKKEDDAAAAPQPTPPAAQQTQQLQYAALLALQLQQQQQQQARAAAAAAQAQQQQQQQPQGQQQQQQARPAAAAAATAPSALTGAPAALAQNVFPQQGMAHAANAKAPAPPSAHVKPTRGRQGAGGPGGLPLRSAAAAGATGAGRGGAHEAKPGKEAKDGEEDDAATDQWVQCSKCQTWRQVPDEFWPDIANADEDEDWMCKDALWDVEDYEPNTPACC